MHQEEIAIAIGIVLVILSIRWWKRSFNYMVRGIRELTKEAYEFEKACEEEKREQLHK